MARQCESLLLVVADSFCCELRRFTLSQTLLDRRSLGSAVYSLLHVLFGAPSQRRGFPRHCGILKLSFFKWTIFVLERCYTERTNSCVHFVYLDTVG